jgi:hypothetical protein
MAKLAVATLGLTLLCWPAAHPSAITAAWQGAWTKGAPVINQSTGTLSGEVFADMAARMPDGLAGSDAFAGTSVDMRFIMSVRRTLEPGAKVPAWANNTGPYQPGAFFAFRKGFEELFFYFVPIFLVGGIGLRMFTERRGALAAAWSSSKPILLGLLMLLTYPLVDYAVTWGISTPLMTMIGSPDFKTKVQDGIMESRSSDAAFKQAWIDMEPDAQGRGLQHGDAAGSLVSYSRVRDICIGALSRGTSIDSMLALPREDPLRQDLGRCFGPSVPRDIRIATMQYVRGLTPSSVGEIGADPNSTSATNGALVELGALFRSDPAIAIEVMLALGDPAKPDPAKWRALAGSTPTVSPTGTNCTSSWFWWLDGWCVGSRMAQAIASGSVTLNPARYLGNMLRDTITGWILTLASMVIWVVVFFGAIGAEVARALSFMAAPIVILWATATNNFGQFSGWAKSHAQTAMKPAAVQLMGMFLMILTMAILFTNSGGVGGAFMSLALSIFVPWSLYKSNGLTDMAMGRVADAAGSVGKSVASQFAGSAVALGVTAGGAMLTGGGSLLAQAATRGGTVGNVVRGAASLAGRVKSAGQNTKTGRAVRATAGAAAVATRGAARVVMDGAQTTSPDQVSSAANEGRKKLRERMSGEAARLRETLAGSSRTSREDQEALERLTNKIEATKRAMAAAKMDMKAVRLAGNEVDNQAMAARLLTLAPAQLDRSVGALAQARALAERTDAVLQESALREGGRGAMTGDVRVDELSGKLQVSLSADSQRTLNDALRAKTESGLVLAETLRATIGEEALKRDEKGRLQDIDWNGLASSNAGLAAALELVIRRDMLTIQAALETVAGDGELAPGAVRFGGMEAGGARTAIEEAARREEAANRLREALRARGAAPLTPEELPEELRRALGGVDDRGGPEGP